MHTLRHTILTLALALTSIASAQNTKTYTNPVYDHDSPDPSVQRAQDGTFYCYATACQTRKSKDLVHWTDLPGVFNTPSWNGSGFAVWATDVNYFNGKYVMYYALAQWDNLTTTGIGVATGTTPDKFTDVGRMFRSNEIGVTNSIDACYIEEGDKKYLAWGSFYGIYLAELTDDGLQIKDFNKKTKIAGSAYEGTMIHRRGGYYYLIASCGSCCDGDRSTYHLVVGRSTKLTGPYTNKDGKPMLDNNHTTFLRGNDKWAGPGHCSEIITDDEGNDWLLYHAYHKPDGGKGRVLLLDKITWSTQGWPTIGDGTPTTTPQPAPVFNTGNGADMTFRMENMNLAKTNMKGWTASALNNCTKLQNGTNTGTVHMPLLQATGGQFEYTQQRNGMPEGIYQLSLDNFATGPGVEIIVGNTATPAHNAALDEKKPPVSNTTAALRFLRSDDYRQSALGLLKGNTLTIGLKGTLAENDTYYAADLKLIYKARDENAAAQLLTQYIEQSHQIIHTTQTCHKPYLQRLQTLTQEASATTTPYATLLQIHNLQDTITQNISLYTQLSQQIQTMHQAIQQAQTLGIHTTQAQTQAQQAQDTYTQAQLNNASLIIYLAQFNQAISTLQHTFVAGNGSAENPYLVATPQQLEGMADALVADTMVHFALTADIDMTGHTWKALNTSANKYRYRINFDGQGHLIKNITMADESYPSFFGTLCGNCRNTGFVNATVNSNRTACAIIAGYTGHSSYIDENQNPIPVEIENCYITGTINTTGYGGAIAGVIASGTSLHIQNTYTNVDMQGGTSNSNRMGGFVGRVWGQLTVHNSYAAGNINAAYAAGIAAGGQNNTTPPSTYQNVIAWQTKLTGSKQAQPFAYTATDDQLTHTYNWDGMIVNNEPTDGTTTEQLQAIAATWGQPWHNNPAAGNGYPILEWQYQRGDYHTQCGFNPADAITPPNATHHTNSSYYRLDGTPATHPTQGIYIYRNNNGEMQKHLHK